MMNHLTTICIVFLFLASTQILIAQETITLSLKDAQDYAVKHAFAIQTALADEEVAMLTTKELLGAGFPQVNASAQYQNYIDLPTSLVPAEFFGGEPGQFARLQFGTPHNMTVGLNANQLLFDGSWLIGLEASKAYAALQQKLVKKSEIEVKEEVSRTYHLAIIARENHELLLKSRDILSGLLNETGELWKSGFAEEQDAQQLELSVNDLENRISYAEQQVRITEDLLKFQIGMPLSTPIQLSENAEVLLTSASGITAPGFTSENNIDVQVAQGALVMQELNLRNQKAKRWPQASAFYNLQTQAQRNKFNFLDTGEPWFPVQLWGVQLNVPLFSGMSKNRSVQKARVEVRRTTDMLNLAREAALMEYNAARMEYEYAEKNLVIARRSLELAEDILRKTNIKFREGVTSSFELSQINTQVVTAQGNYVQAMLALLNAKTRWIRAMNQY